MPHESRQKTRQCVPDRSWFSVRQHVDTLTIRQFVDGHAHARVGFGKEKSRTVFPQDHDISIAVGGTAENAESEANELGMPSRGDDHDDLWGEGVDQEIAGAVAPDQQGFPSVTYKAILEQNRDDV